MTDKEDSSEKKTKEIKIETKEAVEPKKPIKNKKRKIILSIVLAIMILIFGYFEGSWYYGKERQLDNLADNLTSGVPAKMSKSVVTADGKSITDKKLEPLKRLFNKDNNATAQIKTIIEHESSYSNFQVVRAGRYFGVFPRYRIALKKRNILVETDLNKPIFKIAGKNIAAKKSGDEYYLKKSYPGLYSVDVTDQSGKLNKTRNITVPISGQCNETDVEVTMKHTPSP